jgi:hypothetical protein
MKGFGHRDWGKDCTKFQKERCGMSQRLYNVVQWLLFSRLVRGYGEHHGPYEDVLLGYLLCFFLEINNCFVLDHRDASISFRVPTPWGALIIRYVVCLGDDKIRTPGFKKEWWPKMPKVVVPPEGHQPEHDEAFPF